MASVEFIEKRIEGKKKEIEKLEKKLDRILKAQASNWENNPYYYDESDLKWTNRDLDAAKVSLENLENELQKTIEKDNSRDVKAIIEFLDAWKKKVFDFYNKDLISYYDEYTSLVNRRKEMSSKYGYFVPEDVKNEYEKDYKALRQKLNGYTEKREYTNRYGKQDYEEVKVRDGEWEHLKPYINRGGYNDAIAYLKKDLEAESKAKYDFIIERTNAICGAITDASGLEVSSNGELNGIIIGERGNAKVHTIGAGGYNIQRFHFRVLVKKVA